MLNVTWVFFHELGLLLLEVNDVSSQRLLGQLLGHFIIDVLVLCFGFGFHPWLFVVLLDEFGLAFLFLPVCMWRRVHWW